MSRSRRLLLKAGCLAGGLPGAWASTATAESTLPEVTLLHNESVPIQVWAEVLAMLGREVGLRWRLSPLPWARAQMLAQQGDGLLFGTSNTADRREKLTLSQPFAESRVWLVQRQGEFWPIHEASQLAAYSLCMSRNSRYSDRFEALRMTWPRKEFTDAGAAGVTRMVRAGRCDLGLIAVRGTRHAEALATLKLRNIDMEGLVLREPWLEKLTMHFAAAKDSALEPWIAKLDAVIRTRRGDIDALLRAAKPPS